MNLIDVIEKENVKENIPEFGIGDTVKVFYKIKEGNKERIQGYEGTVIARKNGGVRETFTVRRVSFGVGIERTFPLHSPKIDKIEVLKKGKVRRAKLFYLRDLSGKATNIKDKPDTILYLIQPAKNNNSNIQTIAILVYNTAFLVTVPLNVENSEISSASTPSFLTKSALISA